MAVEFKVGDILEVVPSQYTVVLVVRVFESLSFPNKAFGEGIPMFGRFPLGAHLYDLGRPEEWKVLSPARYLISLPEAKRALIEAWEKHSMDNLTYIELLNTLNERTQP